MKCSKCENEITNESAKFCDKCGAPIDAVSQNQEQFQNPQPQQNTKGGKFPVWAIVLIVVGVLLGIGLIVGCVILFNGSNNTSTPGVTDYTNTSSSSNSSLDDYWNSLYNEINSLSSKKKTYGFNEKFTFDNLEISIGNDYVFKTVNNRYSEYNGKTVVGVPMTIKNLSQETNHLNMFFYKIFGSSGTEVEKLNSYFDNTVEDANNDLRYNASYTKYTYFLYDGDGTYSMEFDNYSSKILVEFDITKK